MNIGATTQPTFEIAVEASISAACLAVIVLIVQSLMRHRLSPAWRFALWLPVMLRLLIPVLPESPLSLFNVPRWIVGADAPTLTMGAANLEAPLPSIEPDNFPVGFEPIATEPVAVSYDWRSIAAMVWLAGALVLLLRLGFGALSLSIRLHKCGSAVSPKLQKILNGAAAQLGTRNRPWLKEAPFIESPALFGLFRPTLLLPKNFAENLSETEIRHVFLHELAHLKRRDLVVNWLMALAQAVHWFNPVVWLVFRRMRLERELACDEMALRLSAESDPRAYGRTILRLLEGVGPRPALSALVGIAEEKQSAGQRLKQIAAFKAGRRRYWLALPLLLAVIVAGLTNAQQPEPEQQPEEKPLIPKLETTQATAAVDANEKTWLKEKLSAVRIDGVEWEGRTLTEMIETIQEKFPAELRDIEFIWHQQTNLTSLPGAYSVNAVGYIDTRIGPFPTAADEIRLSRKQLTDTPVLELSLTMHDIPVKKLLDFIVKAADKPLHYVIEDKRVVFFSAKQGNRSETATLINDGRLLMELGNFEEAGKKFSEALNLDPESRAASYYLHLLKERRFSDEARKRQTINAPMQVPGALPPIANPYARTNRVYNSPGRQALMRKLNDIVLERYHVPTPVKLSEIIKDLSATARKKSADRVGVNFVVSSYLDEPEGGRSARAIDPITGRPMSEPELAQVTDYLVTIDPALVNVRLIDVLDAIIKTATPPEGSRKVGLKYSLEDYAVVFSQRINEQPALYTRTYKVNPSVFVAGLNSVFGDIDGNRSRPPVAPIQEIVRNFFRSAGVDFLTNNVAFAASGEPTPPPQKAIFFNDRTGVLFVRATMRDLDIIESALQMLNSAPAQVTIETQVIELKDQEQLDEVMKIFAGIQGEFRSALTTLQFRRFKNEAKKDFEFLALPRVTTVSGRPARVSMERDHPKESISVDIRPEYEERNSSLRVWASNYDEATKEPGPVFSGRIYDGQTFILLPRSQDGKLIPGRISFITAIAIDPAGNRLNSGDDFILQTERIPPQN